MKPKGYQDTLPLGKNCIDLENLTFCKTILMLLIAFYHSIAFWNGWQNNSPLGKPIFTSSLMQVLADYLSQIHVYAFVVISGYLFCYLQVEKKKYASYFGLIQNKIKRLLIPLAFVSVVWLIPFALFALKYDIILLSRNFLLMEGPLQLWFLLMLFWVFAMAWPLSKLFIKDGCLSKVLFFMLIGLLWGVSFFTYEKN